MNEWAQRTSELITYQNVCIRVLAIYECPKFRVGSSCNKSYQWWFWGAIENNHRKVIWKEFSFFSCKYLRSESQQNLAFIQQCSEKFREEKMCSDFCEWLFTANEMRQKRSADLDWSGLNKTIEEALKTEDADSDGKSYRVKQLFNKHGYNLAILPGHVKGRLWNV